VNRQTIWSGAAAAVLIAGQAVGQTVAPPWGYVRIEIPPRQRALAAYPFQALDPDVSAVLEDQLTGAASAADADRLLFWDAEQQQYVTAFKANPADSPDRDGGRWRHTDEASTPLAWNLEPGTAFYVENRQDVSQNVYLAGAAVMDASQSRWLWPPLNLVGSPYAGALPASAADWPDGELVGDEPLRLGAGYWYRLRQEEPDVWTAARPYADVFGAAAFLPRIRALRVVGGGAEVELWFEAGAAVRLEVYTRAVQPDETPDLERGWSVAAELTPAGAAGKTEAGWWVWRQPIDPEPQARLYLVADADLDEDGDGLPSARERFVLQTDPTQPDTDGDGFSDAIDTLTRHINPIAVDSNEDGIPDDWEWTPSGDGSLTDANENFEGGPVPVRRVIYVDEQSGLDSNPGTEERPVRTIKAGIGLVVRGDVMVLAPGIYDTDFDVAGLDLTIETRGDVICQPGGRP
jgi:hypothetical protein